jgi:GNAT superfamily N-acetyltransferase
MSPPKRIVLTYLEMRSRAELRPVVLDDPDVRIERMFGCPPSFWRYLYTEIGRAYHWVDRLPWTHDQICAYLADPDVWLFLLTVRGAPAGYFELHREPDRSVEIVYFGLLPEFTGRGLGAHLLTDAVNRSWNANATRVWLHTNTLDHPGALPNYVKRGFRVFRTEEREST